MDLDKDLQNTQDEGYVTLSSQSTSASQFSQEVFDFSQRSLDERQPSSSQLSQQSTDQCHPSTSRATAEGSITDTILIPAPSSNHGLTLTIYNIHSRVHFGCELDLKRLTTRIRTAEWVPGRSLGMTLRLLDPLATAIVCKGGGVICMQTKSLEDSNLAMRKVARIVQRCGYPEVRFIGYRVCNIVAYCDLKFPINIDEFLKNHGQFATYSPELFPGVFYRMIRPRVMVIIFVNGSILLNAASNLEDLYKALDNIYEILLKFKKKSINDDLPIH